MLELLKEAALLLEIAEEWDGQRLGSGSLPGPHVRVLGYLLVEGKATVPSIGRALLASRQHIQQQVDALLNEKLVERRVNPAHKRSPLIALTPGGRALISDQQSKMRDALARLQTGVSDSAVRDAIRVLAAYRSAIGKECAKL